MLFYCHDNFQYHVDNYISSPWGFYFDMFFSRLMNTIFSKMAGVKDVSSVLDRYIWIDLEMTGFDVNKDKILEIACIITTTDLNPVHEGINLVIHQPEDVLQSMNSWCLEHHSKTNLITASRESKINITEADEMVSDYIKKHTTDKSVRYIAGNSVFLDKFFLQNHMPSVNSLLHYRILDVSTIKILCRHWYMDEYSKFSKKESLHRAYSDIKASINELKFYQEHIFKS